MRHKFTMANTAGINNENISSTQNKLFMRNNEFNIILEKHIKYVPS